LRAGAVEATRDALALELVEADGDDQHRADDDVLPEGVDPEDDQAMTVPGMEPRPPKRLVPPMMTAAIAASAVLL
jgi:hypothetical protein